MEPDRGRRRPLVRPPEQGSGRRIPRPGLRPSGLHLQSRVLRQFTEKFAAAYHISLPFAIDPEGKLAAEVRADTELGRRTGIDHTPTVFIVMASKKGPRYIEVDHPQQDLYRTIDQALAETRSR